MKKTKILVPAAGLLLLSTAASVSGTVAWFSMNTSVNATNMKVSINSASTYLLISNAYTTAATAPADAAAIQSENSGNGYLSMAFTADAKSVYPVSPASALTVAEYYTAQDEAENPAHEAGTIKTNGSHTDYVAGASAGTPTYWYTMVGTNVTSTGYVGKADTEANVTANIDDYVLKYRLYFTIAAGANAATDLVVDSAQLLNSSGTAADASLRCLVVGQGASAPSALFTASTDTDSIVLVSNLNSSTVSYVDVFVWYDGNANTIYTENIGNIAQGVVSLTFKVSA